MHHLVHPSKARPGDRVAVVSPAFAAPAVAEAVHEQAMRRLSEATGLIPVEYPTTRRLDASAVDRAADLNTAFADPDIRAVLATIGGEDQITVIPHLDATLVRTDPKPFLGMSDNTNLHTWLWTQGVVGFYVVRPRCISDLGPASIRAIWPLCGPHCSPGSGCRSPSLASRRTSGRTGTTPQP